MPEHRTRALVLRTFDHGESDRLVHLYTEGVGRVSAIAKGARRSKRRFPGTLEIFSLLNVHLVDPPRAALMRLDGAELVYAPEGIVAHLGRYAVACLLLELMDRFTGEREANPDLFHFACGVTDVVAGDDPDRLLALLVLCKTLSRLGYRPQLVRCSVCGRLIEGAVRIGFSPRHGGAVCPPCSRNAEQPEASAPADLLARLEAGIRTPLRERRRLGLGPEAVRRAEMLLDRFFQFHVGLDLRTLGFCRKVLQFRHVDSSDPAGDNAPAPGSAEGSIGLAGERADRGQ